MDRVNPMSDTKLRVGIRLAPDIRDASNSAHEKQMDFAMAVRLSRPAFATPGRAAEDCVSERLNVQRDDRGVCSRVSKFLPLCLERICPMLRTRLSARCAEGESMLASARGKADTVERALTDQGADN